MCVRACVRACVCARVRPRAPALVCERENLRTPFEMSADLTCVIFFLIMFSLSADFALLRVRG